LKTKSFDISFPKNKGKERVEYSLNEKEGEKKEGRKKESNGSID
jgi:hypothetical protein